MIEDENELCSHGTSLDIHCCDCHSGFLFDIDSCTCELNSDRRIQMKRYYTTSSPDAARHILRETEQETINEAVRQVESGIHDVRYVVKIVKVVKRAERPVRVIDLDKDEED